MDGSHQVFKRSDNDLSRVVMFVAVLSRREVSEKCSDALNRAREVSRYLPVTLEGESRCNKLM